MKRHAQICSTGRYIPDKVITNFDIEKILGEPVNDWLIENVGMCNIIAPRKILIASANL